MDDRFEASIGEAYDRGVEAGRADAVPPNTEPMKWCEIHDAQWVRESGCLSGWADREKCRRESKVAHWVTAKETT